MYRFWSRRNFRRGHGRRRRLRAYFLAGVAQRFDFVEALLFLVDAHGEELDDLLGYAQAEAMHPRSPKTSSCPLRLWSTVLRGQ